MTTLIKSTQVSHAGQPLSAELANAADIALEYSGTYDPASMAAGATTSVSVTVTGAVMGDYAIASHTQNLAGCLMTAYVSAINTVTVLLLNTTAGSVNIATGTLKVAILRKGV